MRTITTEVYKFDELEEKAQEKAISESYYVNIDDSWHETVFEDAKAVGLQLACFDVHHYCKGHFLNWPPDVAEAIVANHGDCCESYKTAKTFLEAWEQLDEESDNYDNEADELKEEFLNSLLEDYRIMLRNDYEYMISDPAIKETLESEFSHYEFYEDGTPYN